MIVKPPPPPPVTAVVAVAVLLAVSGSGTVDVTLTVFVSVPACVAVTTVVIVALEPFCIVPRLHVTVVVPEQLPCDVAADTNVTPAGNTSVAVTFVAFNGSKVIKVKEEYAGLGTQVADPKVPR